MAYVPTSEIQLDKSVNIHGRKSVWHTCSTTSAASLIDEDIIVLSLHCVRRGLDKILCGSNSTTAFRVYPQLKRYKVMPLSPYSINVTKCVTYDLRVCESHYHYVVAAPKYYVGYCHTRRHNPSYGILHDLTSLYIMYVKGPLHRKETFERCLCGGKFLRSPLDAQGKQNGHLVLGCSEVVHSRFQHRNERQ